MAGDPTRRRAAVLATVVALPVALAVLALLVWRATPRPAVSLRTAPPPVPTTAVSMPAPQLAPAAASVCRDLVAALPAVVRNAPRRQVSAGSAQNAAWGEPPLTLACGGPSASYAPTDQVSGLSGVCWLPRIGAGETVWTTLDRTVVVTVRVPGPPDGSAQYVIGFSAAISATDPRLATPPPGCP